MNKAVITIEVDPMSFEEAERVRGIFLALLGSGALNVKSGSATLHFDHQGTLQEIAVQFVRKWRRTGEGSPEAPKRDMSGQNVKHGR